jgi:AAA+ superfamily predicted ATPase
MDSSDDSNDSSDDEFDEYDRDQWSAYCAICKIYLLDIEMFYDLDADETLCEWCFFAR